MCVWCFKDIVDALVLHYDDDLVLLAPRVQHMKNKLFRVSVNDIT